MSKKDNLGVHVIHSLNEMIVELEKIERMGDEKEVFIKNMRRDAQTVREDRLAKVDGCELCDFGYLPNLEMHHIYPVSSGGSNHEINTIFLCSNCHYLAHHLVSDGNMEKYGETYIEDWVDNSFSVGKRELLFKLILRYPREMDEYLSLSDRKTYSLSEITIRELREYYKIYQFKDKHNRRLMEYVDSAHDFTRGLINYVKNKIKRGEFSENREEIIKMLSSIGDHVHGLKEIADNFI